MRRERLIDLSEGWFRLLLWLYPADFRDEMGDALAEAYRDRAREALGRTGIVGLVRVWFAAFADSLHSGPGERARPAVSWRRGGNWGRDVELATRRLMRAPALVLAVAGTLTVGLGMFAVVYTVVHKVLIEPMPYRDPDDLYFVWRDYGPMFDLKRGWLAGTDIAVRSRRRFCDSTPARACRAPCGGGRSPPRPSPGAERRCRAGWRGAVDRRAWRLLRGPAGSGRTGRCVAVGPGDALRRRTRPWGRGDDRVLCARPSRY